MSYISKLNKRGVSLIELLIVLSIMLILATAGGGFLTFMLKQDKLLRQLSSLLDNTENIKKLLSKPENCTRTFKGLKFEEDDKPIGVYDANGANPDTNSQGKILNGDTPAKTFYKAATSAGAHSSNIGSDIRIKAIKKRPYSLDEIAQATPMLTEEIHTVVITYYKEGGLGGSELKREFEITVTRDDKGTPANKNDDEYLECQARRDDILKTDIKYQEDPEQNIHEFSFCEDGSKYQKTYGSTSLQNLPSYGAYRKDQSRLMINYGTCYSTVLTGKDFGSAEKNQIRNQILAKQWVKALDVEKMIDPAGKYLFIPETYQLPVFGYCKDKKLYTSEDANQRLGYSTDGARRHDCDHCETGTNCNEKWVMIPFNNGLNTYNEPYRSFNYSEPYHYGKRKGMPNTNKIFDLYYRLDSTRNSGGQFYNGQSKAIGERTKFLGSPGCTFVCAIKARCEKGLWIVDAQACKAQAGSVYQQNARTEFETKFEQILENFNN